MPATQSYWPLVMDSLKNQVSGSNYKAWFSRLQFVSTTNQGRKLILGVPSLFSKKYIESKYRNELKEAVSKYYPQVIHIDFQIQKPDNDTEVPIQQTLVTDNPAQVTAVTNTEQSEKPLSHYLPKKSLNNLNPKYTFDGFVVTRNNEFAVNVIKAVLDQPGTLYNPVFIYGGVGLGKTHLMQAMGHKMIEMKPGYNIKYIPSETFVNQFQFAIQKRRMDEFRDYYRSIDLLLIDDVQFLAGKEATQEEFFHTFNSLQQLNKQIVITSDRLPKDIKAVEERLISRFECGMVVDISSPDLEDRIAILLDKVERMKLPINKEQVTLIAQHVTTNVRELEGALNKVKAKLMFSQSGSLTNDDIIAIIGGNSSQTSSFTPSYSAPIEHSPDKILQSVCKFFNISKADIIGAGRQKDIALARQVTMWFYKNELEMSYPTIGKLFSGRDHTTIMHGCNKIDSLLNSDSRFKEKIEIIKNLVRAS